MGDATSLGFGHFLANHLSSPLRTTGAVGSLLMTSGSRTRPSCLLTSVNRKPANAAMSVE